MNHSISPAPTRNRYDVVDALRGFAIMGILLLHSIEHFNYYVFLDDALQPDWMVAWNGKIWDTMFFLFGSKAYGLFAILFGFTFHLQFSRQAEKGVDFGPIFLWRMLLLFGFGWVNCVLFPGEVLLLYAVLGPALFFVRKFNNWALLVVAIFFLAQPLEVYQLLQRLFNPDYPLIDLHVNDRWGQVGEAISSGKFSALILNWWTGFKATFTWSLENGRIEQTVGLFMLGVLLGRKQWFQFQANKQSIIRWLVTLIICSVVFALFIVFEKTIQPHASEQIAQPLGTLKNVWKNLFQMGIYISLFCSLSAMGWFRWITYPLRCYGRMSLSNYILQSVFGGIIFYPWALGLADDMNTIFSLSLGFGLFIIYVTISNLWFLQFKFRQGPCEMLWHYLTWFPVKAMAKQNAGKS